MDKQQAKQIIQKTFENSFDKGQFIEFIKNLLNRIEEATFIYQGQFIPEAYRQYIRTFERIGKFNDDENRVDILVIKLQKETSIERARTMQRNFVAGYLQGKYGSSNEKEAALVAFVSPDEEDWRFSLVKMDYKFEQTKTGRIKVQEEFTPARRWSFLVGKNENSHTAQSRLVDILANDEHSPTLYELEKAFDIGTVTKEFFIKYRDLFVRTKEELDKVVKNDSKIKADFKAKDVNTVDFAKKLLGQIIFLYFLQKKGWFGVDRDAKWGTGSKHFLRELFKKKHSDYKNFFNDILEPLFYEALRIDRSHDDDYYSRFNCKIPFLNGGLFDPIGNYDWVHTDILLPGELFSNDVNTKEDIGDGILDIFDRYNFTVREDEPLEKEVAIDPELLGKAYEKFNAIRPDNFEVYKKALKSGNKGEESKFNKQYGVYYTPREIVHYMCQQSLINYLYTALNDAPVSYEKLGKAQTLMFKDIDKKPQMDLTIEHSSHPIISKEDIEALIHTGEQVSENEEIALIKEQKILEGKQKSSDYKLILSESIRNNASLIDQTLSDITVCDPAVGSGAFPVGMMSEIVKARNVLSLFIKAETRTTYDFKRQCIEHSLYGVDIDSGAVEIAKLRLWLSLVVDEDDIKNIKPLPNLDYKVVCGNSLLGVKKDLLNDHLFKELETLKPFYFNETNPTKKQEFKKQIDGLISQITNGHKEFDFEVYFSEVFHHKGGFDVVIANPPYGAELTKGEKDLFKIQYDDVHIRTPDTFNYFISKSLRILNKDCRGLLSFIVSNNLLFQNEYQKTREVFLKKNRVIKVLNLGDEVFKEAVVPTCVFLVKNRQQEQYNFEFADLRTYKQRLDGLDFNSLLKPFFKKDILETPGYVFGVNQAAVKLLKKVEKLSVKIDEIAGEVASGISTGGDKVFRISQKFAKENKFEDEILRKVLKGGEIHKYQIEDTNHFVIYTFKDIKIEKYPNIHSYLKPFQKQLRNKRETRQGKLPWWCLHWHRYPGLFEGDKILIRQTSDELIATIDTKEYYALNSLLVIKLKSNSVYILKFVLSIINSKICNFIYKQITQEEGRTFAEVKPQNIRKLYIPKFSETAQQPFITLVDQILSAKQKDPNADTSALEREIDKMVYELYGLTPDEIEIVEGK